MKILITRRIHQDAINSLLRNGFDVKYYKRNEPLDKEILKNILPGFDGILTCVSDNLNSELLKIASNKLKVISNMAVGLDNIDLASALNFGISVFNTPNVVTESTADMTIALTFALLRKITTAHSFVIEGSWQGWDPEIFVGRSFSKLNWGIIGFGNIGKAVARRLSGFDMQVYFHDPDVQSFPLYNAIKIDLNTLLNLSDIISLHLPLSDKTHHYINASNLNQMKSSSILINMARGGVVN